MKRYLCSICGYEFDESGSAGTDGQIVCPMCGAGLELLTEIADEPGGAVSGPSENDGAAGGGAGPSGMKGAAGKG